MARPTPEQVDAIRKKYRLNSEPIAPTPVAVPEEEPVTQRQQSRGTEEKQKAATASGQVSTAEAQRRRASIVEQRRAEAEAGSQPQTFSQALAQINADQNLKESSPPIYAGGYDLGTTTPLLGAVPAARPMNIAVPSTSAPGLLEAMRPQTQVDPARAQRDADRVGQVFDDSAFMESIKDSPTDQKKSQLDAYSAFKRAFAKMRADNPVETGVTDQEIVADLRRQITDAAEGRAKTLTQKPQAQLPGGIGAALQSQVKEAKIPMLEPGALAFFDELNRRNAERGEDEAVKSAVDNLKKTGVPVMSPVPGNKEGLERQTGTRSPGQPDIDALEKSVRASYRQENPTKFWETLDRDTVLNNIEKNATGGTLFEKKYQTGATVESSLSHALRSVFAIPNYIAGTAVEMVTPESTAARERAARPPLYRDASAGVYNVAEGRGFMGEIQDLYKYSPSETLRNNQWIGTTFGFAADMLGLESAAVGAAASGVRALRAEQAAGLAGARFAERAGQAAEAVGKTTVSTFMKDIGLPSIAEKITPGDIRLKLSGGVADNYIAVAKYEDARAAGASHTDALNAAGAVAPNSTAVQKMRQDGPSFSPSKFVSDSKAEYDEFKSVYDAVQDAKAGGTARLTELRPYLKAAVKNPTVEAQIIRRASASAKELAPTMKIKDVVDEIKQAGSIDDIVSAAAVDKGFKAIDRKVGVLEPGKEVVAITPRTFGTASGAEAVIKEAKASDIGMLLTDIRKEKPAQISFRSGGQTVTDVGYELTGGQLSKLRDTLVHEANTGTIPNAAVKKAVNEMLAGVISNESLREISYSVADGIATRMQSEKAAKTFASTALVPTTSKVINYGSGANSIKLKIEQISKSITDRIGGTSKEIINRLQLSPEQTQLISEAKSKFTEIDKTLKSEFNALDTADAQTLREYGLPESGATPSQKMAAITLGRKPDRLSIKSTLNNWLRSTLFGTENVSASRFLGDYIFGVKGFGYESFDAIFNVKGRANIDAIVSKYADLIQSPDDALRLLPQMTDEVVKLTTVMKTDASGAVSKIPEYLNAAYSGKRESEIFKLSTRPEEAMIGTYARNKGDLIFQDTIDRLLSFDALATSDIGQIITSSVKGLDYNGILQAGVAHQLSNGAPLQSIDDLLKIPKVRKIDQEFFKITGLSLEDIAQGSSMSQILEDINGTAAVVASKFKLSPASVRVIDYGDEIKQIARGDIKLSELGGADNPFSLRQAVRQELGSGAKYDQLQVELGKLAEAEAKGSASAAKVSSVVNTLFDTFNSFFYNAILSYNPRFHGRNFFFAPSIIHMTTGIGINPKDMLSAARIMDPLYAIELVTEKTPQELAKDVVVTDKLGNPYTAGELYKLAVESGILKSAASTAVDARFLDEAAKLGLGKTQYKGAIKRALTYPAHIASAEDNLWRMATIVHAIEGGETLESALRLGRRSLFDFGAATAFERQYISRKILFYNYFRNSVIQAVRTLLENPSRILKQYRLVTDVSKIAVGDEQWDNLRFYAPMDAGVAAVATKYAPTVGREGQLTVLPNMPYADAAIIVTGLMYQPINFILGQPDLVTGKHEFGSSYVYQKLGPSQQTAVKIAASKAITDDVRTRKNQLSLVHVAFADMLESGSQGTVPALKALEIMFNVRERAALPGEDSFKGKIYEMDPVDFENYKRYVFGTLQTTGTQRFVDEWSQIYGGLLDAGFTGAKQRGIEEIIGLQSKTVAPSPISRQTTAMTTAEEALKKGTSTMEEGAGMERRKAPAASGRTK